MKILIFDNYDSFTYNLLHIVQQFTDAEVDVVRNDKISLEEIEKYDGIILSPGPGIPSEAGILLDLIKKYHATKPILGVCLGLQAIAEAFGGSLINLDKVMHGVATHTLIKTTNESLFNGMKLGFLAGRYHSWVVNPETLPPSLEVTAVDDEGEIMAIRHRRFNVKGVQFHPESVLTQDGSKIIENWLIDNNLDTKMTLGLGLKM